MGNKKAAAILSRTVDLPKLRVRGGCFLICDVSHGVSTGSGSDRVSGDDKIELDGGLTRSLPLPVLTSLRGKAAGTDSLRVASQSLLRAQSTLADRMSAIHFLCKNPPARAFWKR